MDVDNPPEDWDTGWSSLMGAARSVAGKAQIPPDEVARNGSVLREWRDTGAITAMEAWLAIVGARRLVDAGRIAWIPRGAPFGLRALKARTVHREGTWPVWVAALEAGRDASQVVSLPIIDDLAESKSALPFTTAQGSKVEETERNRSTALRQLEAMRRAAAS